MSKGFLSRIFSGFSAIDEDFYDELEEQMILGDMGVTAAEDLLDSLRSRVKEKHIKSPEECRAALMADIENIVAVPEGAYDFENKKSVVVVIGVNGVGKTTCCGKLAYMYAKAGKKVLLAGADTFRAAAAEQLKTWAERVSREIEKFGLNAEDWRKNNKLNNSKAVIDNSLAVNSNDRLNPGSVEIVTGAEGADPGSVVYDACAAARARNVDILICDTAGRLHNKKNLMNELAKIGKIIAAELPGFQRENLIVVDASTGQNALMQAREFSEVFAGAGVVLSVNKIGAGSLDACSGSGVNSINVSARGASSDSPAAETLASEGIILTKMDGTAKGGITTAIAAELSIPVKFIGVGEGIDDLKRFDACKYVEELFS